jgi:hypothetical protein
MSDKTEDELEKKIYKLEIHARGYDRKGISLRIEALKEMLAEMSAREVKRETEHIFKVGDIVRVDGRDAYVAAINDEEPWVGRYVMGFPGSAFMLRCKASDLEFVKAADSPVEPLEGPFEPLIFPTGKP